MFDAVEQFVRLALFDNGPFYVLKLEQRRILDLIDLDGIVLDFPQFEESILHNATITLTISLFILDL